MKVFIITEGGRNIGLGHLTRCTAICQAFMEKGIKPDFIVNRSLAQEDFLKKNRINLFIKDYSKIKNCDILIIDSYLKPKDFYYRAARNTGLLVSIDDFNRLHYPGGLVVNGSVYAETLHYRKKKDLKYLLGPGYVPLRKEFWKVGSKKIKKHPQNVLLTFGGYNDSFAKKAAIFLLKNFGYTLHILLSKKDKFTDSDRISIYHRIPEKEIKRLMLTADICISAGGQTIYESARCGIPALGICFSENQRLNLKYSSQTGFLKFLGWHHDKGLFKDMASALKKMDYKNRIEMSRIGKASVDGGGARRLVREILDYAKN